MNINPVKQVQKTLSTLQLEAILIENKEDLFYLTGLPLSVGKLLISKNSATLLVDSRYYEMAKSHFNTLPDDENNWKMCCGHYQKIGFDGLSLSWERVQSLKNQSPEIEWVSVPLPLKEIRALKSPKEIEKLGKAADLGSEGYDYLVDSLKEGITEKELAHQLDCFWRDRGAKGFSFEPIIAFGENSALPHWRANDRALKKGDTVLLDIGVIFDDYHSDMTRTLFFGEPDPEMKKIYEIVREAQARAIRELKPGVTGKMMDAVARNYIDEQGYGKAFSHSLGHGIGLETHEWPFLRSRPPYGEDILQEHMCVTIEPGIYLPGLGGVRIEDTLLITEKGCKTLTKRPTDLRIIKPHA